MMVEYNKRDNSEKRSRGAEPRLLFSFSPKLNSLNDLFRKVGRLLRNWKAWAMVGGWAALIFGFSSIPNLHTGLACDMIMRKTAHVIEYFLLTFFLYRAIGSTFRFRGLHLSFALVAVVFLYAASDEFHQFFVRGRYSEVRDVLIDQIGVLLFFAFLYLAPRLTRLRAAVLGRRAR